MMNNAPTAPAETDHTHDDRCACDDCGALLCERERHGFGCPTLADEIADMQLNDARERGEDL